MKKTLLALAALAATSASFAQSSVTLYGTLDASIESVKGLNTFTRVSSGNLTTSNFGLKGMEDLGNGVNAKFDLQSGINVDTGGTYGAANYGNSRFFDRAAWVGLSSKDLGEVRLGRQESSIGIILATLGGQAYDDLKIVGTRAGDRANKYRMVDNGITYLLPSLVSGLTAQIQYTPSSGSIRTNATTKLSSTAVGTENTANLGSAYGFNVVYNLGPVSAGVGYLGARNENGDTTAGAPALKANATEGYVSYDLGVAKLTGYFDSETSVAASPLVNNARLNLVGGRVAVPVTPELTTVLSYSKTKNVNGVQAGGDDVNIINLKALYTLSKRTTAYAMFASIKNGSTTSLSLGDSFTTGSTPVTTNGQRSSGLAVGVRHAF